MLTRVFVLPCAATVCQHGVQGVEARRRRDRRHEVGPRVFDQPLDPAFVVALARAAEAVREQAVADQLREGAGPIALAVAASMISDLILWMGVILSAQASENDLSRNAHSTHSQPHVQCELTSTRKCKATYGLKAAVLLERGSGHATTVNIKCDIGVE